MSASLVDFAYFAGVSALLMIVVAILSFVGSAAVIAALFWLVGRARLWNSRYRIALGHALFFGFPFSVLGVTVGFVTSLSREPAAAAVLPAVLSLVGAVCVYIVSKGGKSAIISAVAVVMLCVSFSAGIGYGARARVQNEQAATSPTAQMALANIERNIKRYRKKIGLEEAPPPSPPSAVSSGTAAVAKP